MWKEAIAGLWIWLVLFSIGGALFFGDRDSIDLLKWLLGLPFAWLILMVIFEFIKAYSKKPLLPSSTPDLLPAPTGGVYLLKAGSFYKIGKATIFDRRIKQIKLQLPFPVEVIHKIYCHNTSEVEIYWHRRFAHKRKNGEWFELSDQDVAEFTSKSKM